jgi:predicted MPP superfamily phosphohydrolase
MTRDDLDATLGQVKDKAPIILLAHEPYIFSRVPDRISLTLCGHTHGGQIHVPIPLGPPLPSLATRNSLQRELQKAYGHLVQRDRHLIISAGLGTSYCPFVFGFFPLRCLRMPYCVAYSPGEIVRADRV